MSRDAHAAGAPGTTVGPDSAVTIGVTVNGDGHRLSAGTTVAALLELLGHDARGLAVALDADVVPRSAWASTTLTDGATVEILAAAQGG